MLSVFGVGPSTASLHQLWPWAWPSRSASASSTRCEATLERQQSCATLTTLCPVCAARWNLHAHLGHPDLRLPHRVRTMRFNAPLHKSKSTRTHSHDANCLCAGTSRRPRPTSTSKTTSTPWAPTSSRSLRRARPTTASPTTTRTPTPSSSSTRPSGTRCAPLLLPPSSIVRRRIDNALALAGPAHVRHQGGARGGHARRRQHVAGLLARAFAAHSQLAAVRANRPNKVPARPAPDAMASLPTPARTGAWCRTSSAGSP